MRRFIRAFFFLAVCGLAGVAVAVLIVGQDQDLEHALAPRSRRQ